MPASLLRHHSHRSNISLERLMRRGEHTLPGERRAQRYHSMQRLVDLEWSIPEEGGSGWAGLGREGEWIMDAYKPRRHVGRRTARRRYRRCFTHSLSLSSTLLYQTCNSHRALLGFPLSWKSYSYLTLVRLGLKSTRSIGTTYVLVSPLHFTMVSV